jgi:hypothetical protein
LCINLRYYSGWNPPYLRGDWNAWVDVPFSTDPSPGWWAITLPTTAVVQFAMTNGVGVWDNPSGGGNYFIPGGGRYKVVSGVVSDDSAFGPLVCVTSATASATNSTLASLSELHADGDLQYSAREPAINVYYAPSGEFLPHQDHHSLTVLIPLSSAAGRRGRWLFQSSFIAGAARAFFGP